MLNPSGMPDAGTGSSEQAAAYIGIAAETLKKWRKRGTGPRFLVIGRERRYLKKDLDAWLELQAEPASA